MRDDIGAFRTRARVLCFVGRDGEYGAWDGAGSFWCKTERTRVSGYIPMTGLAAEGWKITLRARAISRRECFMIGGQRHWILDVTPPEDGYMTVTAVTVPSTTVTLYNVSTTVDRTNYTDIVSNNITVLREVLVSSSVAADPTAKGAEGRDSVKLYIPFGSVAVDGITGAHKRYVAPKEYEAAEDRSAVWTMRPGGGCFFLRGEAVEPEMRLQELSEKYGEVFSVGKVATHDFYSLRHFEVEGA